MQKNALSNEGGHMKEWILYALTQSALEQKKVVQMHIFSLQAKYAVTSSSEFFRGSFLDIPVFFLGRGQIHQWPDLLRYADASLDALGWLYATPEYLSAIIRST
jgi:hypothetical protein